MLHITVTPNQIQAANQPDCARRKEGVKMRSEGFLWGVAIWFLCALCVSGSVFAEDGNAKQIMIHGTFKDGNGNPISNGIIKIFQGESEIEESTASDGSFRVTLSPGPAKIIYQAPGYRMLTDKLVLSEDLKSFDKTFQTESVGGCWSLLLLVPGVFGLLVAWGKEVFREKRRDRHDPQDRLLLCLFNGFIWAGVLAGIWYGAAAPQGISKVQLFHHSLTFEFYVPLLGFFGSLLYVFDLFRSQEVDNFKEREFGMRIIMGPYVAIIMVALYGKDLDFIDLGSDTGQGTLAFISGLLVVVALQGIIERANEFLGRWRRQSGYHPSPIARKFKLSEEEDRMLHKIAIRHPEQLRNREESELKEEVKKAGFDEHLAVTLKRSLEREQFQKEVGELIWKRLETINVKTIQDFSRLTDQPLKELAQKKPELSEEKLLALRDQALKFVNNQHEKYI